MQPVLTNFGMGIRVLVEVVRSYCKAGLTDRAMRVAVSIEGPRGRDEALVEVVGPIARSA